VRHHSPACAAALPAWLDRVAPAVVAVELPEDLGAWIAWLGHPAARAPLAVAAVDERGEELGFFPFADFSPELAAIRWARGRGVPAVAIDLPTTAAAPRGERAASFAGVQRRLLAHAQVEDLEDLWDQLVEARATGGDPERVRRAALLYGWAGRLDAARGGGVPARDLRREAHMRGVLAGHLARGERVAAVVGAFHAAALLSPPRLWSPPGDDAAAPPRQVVSSLIPYAFELLDSRSGYPAGIRDPMWQQRLGECLAAGGEVADLVARLLVELTREVRRAGHAAGVADARAAAALALDLARLRRLPAPGRRELVEAVQTALAQGELRGRGRVLARALERVLVGRRRGEVAPGTPRSGLLPHVVALLGELRLPGPGAVSEDPTQLRLDPLRSPIDRRRHVALARLAACGVPYGREEPGEAAGAIETLTRAWTVRWQPATEALLELAGVRGVTLRQAAAGALRAELARLAADDALTAARRLGLAAAAAECGLGDVLAGELAALAGPRLDESGLVELVGLLSLIERVRAGHVIGLPSAEDAVAGEIEPFEWPAGVDEDDILAAAERSLEGLAGSERLEDARALLELSRRIDPRRGRARLLWALGRLAAEGAPLMQGAASAVQCVLGVVAGGAIGRTLGGWLAAAVDDAARRALALRLRGTVVAAAMLFEAAPDFLAGLMERVEALGDGDFLERLPALREGFEVLSTAARRRLLEVLTERLGEVDVSLEDDVELLAACAAADAQGRRAADAIPRPALGAWQATPAGGAAAARAAGAISAIDRWRLILGHERERLTAGAGRAARALDELYGAGHGEGSRAGLGGGGREPAFATAREWTEEIEAVFGGRVRQEVAARAALRGRGAALLELDAAKVTPSVELLQEILSLRGGLPEAHLGRLRALVRHIVAELTRELATRVRPALVGLDAPRPTRRPGGRLHLPRTVSANLRGARRGPDGATLVPERVYFKARARRHADWRVVLVVDVSGSMEPSTIYSAMMAAILAAVPWIDVRFVAFSTEIVDLSAHAADPLALLLEVAVGGGTDIGAALGYARSLVTVPARTLVLLISDLEEGASVERLLGETRALAESGVILLGLAALDDRGQPRYAVPIAELLAGCGMKVAALTPVELARWIGERVR
jgi:hypothetical protein